MEKYIVYAIPAFFVLIFIEILVGYLKGKRFYRFSDAITNLNIGIGSQVVGVLYKAITIAILFYIYEKFAFFHFAADSIWSWVFCFLLFDFLFYWSHRWSHEINFFWGAHVVHHQSDEYNLSVALRQSWFHNLIMFFMFVPIPLLGFEPTVFILTAAISTIYQFWIHTKAIDKLPKIVEFIFNTPSHHRVHHAINDQYLDKNHGAVLIIWDRIFNTFEPESEEVTYGTTTQFKSFNPLWSNFEYYSYMLKQMKKMNFKDAFRIIFSKPGWLPDYLKPDVPSTSKIRKKYTTKVSNKTYAYILVQFSLIVWGTIAYLNNYETLSLFFKGLFAALLVISITICGGILEKKIWLMKAEYLRLAIVCFFVNYFYFYEYSNWFMTMLIFSLICFLVFNILWSIFFILEKRTNLKPY
jgi:sterol desaturase/sphingolipid hydroxylase (fatty acid hydroxylase superfamily)